MSLREPAAGSIVLTTTATGYSAEVDVKGYDRICLFLARNVEAGNVGITPEYSPVDSGDDWYPDATGERTYASGVAVTAVIDPLLAKRLRIFVSTALASSTLGCKYVMTTLNAGSGAL